MRLAGPAESALAVVVRRQVPDEVLEVRPVEQVERLHVELHLVAAPWSAASNIPIIASGPAGTAAAASCGRAAAEARHAVAGRLLLRAERERLAQAEIQVDVRAAAQRVARRAVGRSLITESPLVSNPVIRL